jgi:hypothetical protein
MTIANHQTTPHDTATCDCVMCDWARQDLPLMQLPLEHGELRSLTEAVRAMLREPFEERWQRAPKAMRDDEMCAEYWFQQGRQSMLQEQIAIQVEDLKEVQRVVEGRTGNDLLRP